MKASTTSELIYFILEHYMEVVYANTQWQVLIDFSNEAILYFGLVAWTIY